MLKYDSVILESVKEILELRKNATILDIVEAGLSN